MSPEPIHDSLFTPGFGHRPHFMAGRDSDLASVNAGIFRAPRHPYSVSLLLGMRGFGKTAMLNEIEDSAREDGCLVLSDDASTPGLPERLIEKMWIAAEQGAGIFGQDPPAAEGAKRESSRGVRFGGFEVGTSSADVSPKWSFGRLIRHLGAKAKEIGSHVLISVDEMHAGDRMELVRLAADLQQVSPRDELPIAFVGAALNEALFTFLRDKRLSFFRRGEHISVGPLPDSDIRLCLDRGIRDAAGQIENNALELLVSESNGNPYKMQLLGFWSWQHASAPRRSIDLDDAEMAATQADEIMRTRVFDHVWENLSADERTVIRVVNRKGSQAAVSDVADSVSGSSDTINSMLRRLDAIGALDYKPSAHLRLGPMMDETFVTLAGAAADEADLHRALAGRSAASQQSRQRCNKPMKQVPGRCILGIGHRGRCRSK